MRVLRVALPATAVVLLAAGCTAGTAGHAAPSGRVPSSPSSPAASSPAAVRVTRADAAPGCSTATAHARALGTAGTSLESMPASPLGVVITSGGRWAFVSLADSIAVLRSGGHGAPSLVRTIPSPGQSPSGEVLTRGGRYLVVAAGSGGEVIDVARAEDGTPHAVLGTLTSKSSASAIEVALSPDDRYAFVSIEYSDEVAVFSLQRALAGGFGPSDFIGDIPVGQAAAGLAVSPAGRWLYSISELAAGPQQPGSGLDGQGTLQVISIHRAETDPGRSVVATVSAGCEPVRVITSPDGRVLWVTARASDTLLGFSAARLRTDPAHSIVARVRVGEAPVGLALVRNGARIVVADSDRYFTTPRASPSLAVVDVAAALAGKPALLGYLRPGGFPREMALEPGGRTLLVTNFYLSQLESVNVTDLP
jgi:DNA-binding beta-propeller fold protein YncE